MNISDKKKVNRLFELKSHSILNKLAGRVQQDIEKAADIKTVYTKSKSKNGIINATISFEGIVEDRENVSKSIDNIMSKIITVSDLKEKIGD